ncbi:hypothetical protein CTAYLR_005588 [Chrysophaeum taylorii]|uniref:CheR-type methyltransferase domain-containing protein n=1 Tax=Chrysophaeum taylorii TaxID=2483200 RepID=A0AAD7U4U3_9STRA|nr:hypothetical protein CTAYLR_005588 [Chrysophaeum taylorii]
MKDYRTYSRFARDPQVFLHLVDSVLYTLAQQESVVRVWSVGCAGGEEPYSIAIAWHCAIAAEFPGVRLEIAATDLDEASLDRARAGVFDAHAVANLPVEWIARCFDANNRRRYSLRDEVRAYVRFAHADARTDPPPGRSFSLITCRYSVFLYLPAPACWLILQTMVGVLREAGYLVTGLSDQMPQGFESLGLISLHHCETDVPKGLYRLPSETTEVVSDYPESLAELLARRRRTSSFPLKRGDPPRTTKVAKPFAITRSPSVSKTTTELPTAEMANISLLCDDDHAVLLSRDETERLVERLMADVVRREQRMTKLREDQQRALDQGRNTSKVSQHAFEDFLKRVAADLERRKQSLARLQGTLARDEISSDNRLCRRQEQLGLAGLRTIAARSAPCQHAPLAVRPNRLWTGVIIEPLLKVSAAQASDGVATRILSLCRVRVLICSPLAAVSQTRRVF